jgi:hypothetical protein
VLALDPEHVRARLNLAHLFAGAQLGTCQACERAYAGAPAMLAPERARAELGAVLALDRGESEACVPRAIQTAIALAARVPEARAVEFAAERVRALLATDAPSPAARRRLEEALGRLGTAGGE